ncbi:hypothetical protein Y032_0157g3212 [Ancylostoma ceylanicum]|uniref:Uncharacterized protein n=1 Tax=Ancylostoma ceylanicum TaxID=53326 RepID=A0A016SY73_9BILA|nr:hypothetical protein Y032_0157g3212 [Ancylostoma ceylanicum]
MRRKLLHLPVGQVGRTDVLLQNVALSMHFIQEWSQTCLWHRLEFCRVHSACHESLFLPAGALKPCITIQIGLVFNRRHRLNKRSTTQSVKMQHRQL